MGGCVWQCIVPRNCTFISRTFDVNEQRNIDVRVSFFFFFPYCFMCGFGCDRLFDLVLKINNF